MHKKLTLFVATKAFIQFQGKIVIVKESPDDPSNTQVDKFDIPGGRIDPAETLQEGLIREVEEEVGIQNILGVPFFANEAFTEINDEIWHIVRIFFKCSIGSDIIRLSPEHHDYLWIDPKDYKKYNLIKNLHPAFEKYLIL